MAVAGTLEIEVLMNGKKVRVELNKLLKQMGMIQKSAKYTNKIFGRLARYASIGVLSKMAIDTAKLNKELGLTAERMGVSVESLSQMRNSFKGLGGDAKTFDRIVARINNGISRARIGDGQFVSALSSLTNVSPYDKNGKPRDYFDILKDLSDWTYLQSDKNVAFVKLQSIIPEIDDEFFALLNKGGEEFEKALKTQKGITKEENKNLTELADSWSSFSSRLSEAFDKTISVLSGPGSKILDFFGGLADVAGEHKEASAVGLTALAGWGTFKSLGWLWGLLHGGGSAAAGAGATAGGSTASATVGAGTTAGAGAGTAAAGTTTPFLSMLLGAVYGKVAWDTWSGIYDYAKSGFKTQTDKQIDEKPWYDVTKWIEKGVRGFISSFVEKGVVPANKNYREFVWSTPEYQEKMRSGRKGIILDLLRSGGLDESILTPEGVDLLGEIRNELEEFKNEVIELDDERIRKAYEEYEKAYDEWFESGEDSEPPQFIPPPGSSTDYEPNISVDNNIEITQNSDGTYTTETTTDVSGGGIDFQKSVLSTTNGVGG